jgi:predicted NBD/HSP70 family sugar kinase
MVQEAAHVIGVSLRRDEVAGVVINFDGEIIHETVQPLSDPTPATVVQVISDMVTQLTTANGDRRIFGVGVSLAGVVDGSGLVEYAPDMQSDLDDWRGVGLESLLEEALSECAGGPVLVVVENDANSLAVLEYLRRGDVSVTTILLSGVGIGAGLVVGGKLLPGAHFAAGEGGHIIIDPKGPKCRVGLKHRGCLETMASAEGVLEQLRIPCETTRQIGKGLALAEDRIRDGDESVAPAFFNAGAALGRFLTAIVLIVDPERVVFYGHRELALGKEYKVSEAFQSGVQKGFDEARLSRPPGVADPRLEWHPLAVHAGAQAAGASAVKHFLAHPSRWAPSLMSSGASQHEWV